MKYAVDYEIVRYDTAYITPSGKHIPGETFFQEERAVEFALKYMEAHPEVIVNIYRIERAIIVKEGE